MVNRIKDVANAPHNAAKHEIARLYIAVEDANNRTQQAWEIAREWKESSDDWKGHAKFWERLFWSACCSFAGLFVAFFCLLFGVK